MNIQCSLHNQLNDTRQLAKSDLQTLGKMKLFFFLFSSLFSSLSSSLFFPVFAAPPLDDSLLAEWNEYKLQYSKVYTTSEEDDKRLDVYLATRQRIQQHNRKYERGETSYSMGLNKFADWFPEELDRLNGCKVGETRPRGDAVTMQIEPGAEAPKSWNWVEKGAVTSVKDQGYCGSCYAFSAVGALEGLMYVKNQSIRDLSVQELVDCSDNFGCDGGYVNKAFKYVMDRHGIDSDKSYPYEAIEGYCRASKGEIAASCKGYKKLPRDEEAMRVAVATMGPVSIGFAVSSEFSSYEEGVFEGPCSSRINHGMLAVGYGRDNVTGKDYWLVKNSWGSDWGEEGYVRILRKENVCGIADCTSVPTYDN